MKAKISKSLQEVLDWKEKAYDEVKDLPVKDQVKHLLHQAESMVEELKKEKALKTAK